MTSPRVAWLLTVAPYYWHPLLRQLSRRLPETTLFTAGWPGFAQGCDDAFQVQQVGERRVFSLNPKQKGYSPSVMYLSPRILADLFQFQPQVIFADGFCFWTLLVLLGKLWQRWRVIIVYDGSSPTVNATRSNWRLALRRLMVLSTDALVTNNQAGKAYLAEVLGAKPERIFARPYLVADPSALLPIAPIPNPIRSSQNYLIFLSVGQLIPRKGVRELLAACGLLKQRGVDNFRLWIIGEGYQRPELELFSQTQGLDSQIQWLGKIPYSQLGTYFQQADVVVFPSLEDVWGMVVPEAMAFAKPVLCSQWAGAAELVAHGENGYHFDPHTPEQLAQLISDMLGDQELVDRMGARSRQIIHEHTPEAAAEFLFKVTTRVLTPKQ